MIVITGAAGFIGSALLSFLNENKVYDTVLVDDFSNPSRHRNIAWKHYGKIVERMNLKQFLEEESDKIDAIVHLGAKSGYLHDNWEQYESDFKAHFQNLWKFCSEQQKVFIYANSGSVYGNGKEGFREDDETTARLNPLHIYARMRLEQDCWALAQQLAPKHWYGMRISNVYGPNEYHKASNSSLIYKGYNQILMKKIVKLFASDHPDYEDGGMLRDYIYIKDVVKVIWFFLSQKPASGIYNVGSGEAVSFKEIMDVVFKELEVESKYEYEPIIQELKGKFPYHIQLDISKLRAAGYNEEMTPISEGVKDYIQCYLKKGDFY